MSDAQVAVVVGLVQFAVVAMGVYVSLRPPKKERHRRFAGAFIALGFVGVGLTAWQAKRSAATQNTLIATQNKLLEINKDIGSRVEDVQKSAARSAPRPWVAIEGPVYVLGKADHERLRIEPVYFSMNPFQIRLGVPMRNSGGEPALGVHLDVWATTDSVMLRNPEHCDLVAKQYEQAKAMAFKEGHVLMSGQIITMFTMPATHKPFEPPQPLDASGKNVWLLACIYYYDQFQNLHLSQSCYVLDPAPAGEVPRVSHCVVSNKAY